jgi:adenylate cyclase
VKVKPHIVAGAAVFVLLAIYLFVSAPPELPDGAGAASAIPAESALAVLDAESAAIRAIYTRDIVGEGSRQGLAFNEHWRNEDMAAGPLPALLLRETSQRLHAQMPELGLFLGSDFPLAKANLFTGVQATHYREVKKTLQPDFYYDAALGRTTAMFPDRAVAEACIKCHNEHPASPKRDWVLNEPMGATTWSYAGRQVSSETMLRMVRALRTSAVAAYGAYLQKVASFPPQGRPVVGDKWPREGLYLPDQETFRKAVEAQASAATLDGLFRAVATRPAQGARP